MSLTVRLFWGLTCRFQSVLADSSVNDLSRFEDSRFGELNLGLFSAVDEAPN